MSERAWSTAVEGLAVAHAPLKGPHRLKMGISVLSDPADWLVFDADRVATLRLKRELFAARGDEVWVETEASRPAQEEALAGVIVHLHKHYPHYIERGESGWRATDFDEPRRPIAPLLEASWLVQEDLCLLERDAEGQWRLTAGSVAFPSRWHLPSKLGVTLMGIHEPVPGYREALGRSADRYLDGLRPGRIAVRANWSMMDTPDLFQSAVDCRPRPRPVTAADAGDRVVLRVERQTLRRLPRSDGILFTIRTFRDRLSAVAAQPDAARGLKTQLASMPDDMAGYKAVEPLREPVLAWLDAVAS